MKRKNVFTTSDVAEICQVSTRVVTKWYDTDLLDGFRLPGSKHRRFTYENIKNFMTDEGMPVEWLEAAVKERDVVGKVKKKKRDTKKDIASASATDTATAS